MRFIFLFFFAFVFFSFGAGEFGENNRDFDTKEESVSVVFGFMGFIGIPLDIMTITIAAIGIGIAVDDTIHYLHRFKIEIKKDGDYISFDAPLARQYRLCDVLHFCCYNYWLFCFAAFEFYTDYFLWIAYNGCDVYGNSCGFVAIAKAYFVV